MMEKGFLGRHVGEEACCGTSRGLPFGALALAHAGALGQECGPHGEARPKAVFLPPPSGVPEQLAHPAQHSCRQPGSTWGHSQLLLRAPATSALSPYPPACTPWPATTDTRPRAGWPLPAAPGFPLLGGGVHLAHVPITSFPLAPSASPPQTVGPGYTRKAWAAG